MTSSSLLNRRRFVLLSSASMVSACAARGTLKPVVPAPDDTIRPIFVVTDRMVDPDFHPIDGGRLTTSFGRFDVRVPTSHVVGQVEYPDPDNSDNAATFGITQTQRYETQTSLIAAINDTENTGEDVQVFIHGYNNTMAEGIYRHAQIAHDYDLKGPQISYAWPSAGSSFGYLSDRDSVLISRDGLENLLTALSQNNTRKISIFAHSMGCLLLMETLRQMAIKHDHAGFPAFSSVVLIAPDIDMDLFERQVTRIGVLPDPFTVMISTADRALQLSSLLSGDTDRLGSTTEIGRLQALGVNVIDLSDFDDTGETHHITAASSPSAISLLRGLRNSSFANTPTRTAPSIAEIAFPALERS